MPTPPADVDYAGYLRLPQLLSSQLPLTDVHDELFFVIVSQVHELWFKLILHETVRLQELLESGELVAAVATARRIRQIERSLLGLLELLATLTPAQFAAFRDAFGTASGFDSAQFRELEAVYGRRDFSARRRAADPGLDAACRRRPVFDSLLQGLAAVGHPVPEAALHRDPSVAWPPDEGLQAVLVEVYAETGGAAGAICEALLDIDQGLQDWRYEHVKVVERIIGAKAGSAGTSGADYLRGTLFRPCFPELWAVRSVS